MGMETVKMLPHHKPVSWCGKNTTTHTETESKVKKKPKKASDHNKVSN